jgi:hypothetical protein
MILVVVGNSGGLVMSQVYMHNGMEQIKKKVICPIILVLFVLYLSQSTKCCDLGYFMGFVSA